MTKDAASKPEDWLEKIIQEFRSNTTPLRKEILEDLATFATTVSQEKEMSQTEIKTLATDLIKKTLNVAEEKGHKSEN